MTLPPAAYTSFGVNANAFAPMHNGFNSHNPVPSGSSFKSKRKRMSWAEDEGNKQMRVRSPPLEHRASFPLPELTMDHSAPTSDDDQAMDTDMDQDMDAEMNMAMGLSGRAAQQENYTYSTSGSGGFGFGPGAEEDDEYDMADDMGASAMKAQYGVSHLPSLTPHPNPHHFSNAAHAYGLSSNNIYTHNSPNFRPTSPLALSAPFSTTLQAPSKPAGLLQPSFAAPLGAGASEIEKARSAHGPHCSSIPRLVMSEHADASGKRSLWSVCGDCGACEMAQ